MVRSLPGTASRAVADAASGASERPTSQVVSPTTCDNIVNAVKVVDGFKGDVCSHAPPAPPESCKKRPRKSLETHVHDGRLKLRRAGTRCFHAERRQQPTNAGTVATDCYTVAVEVGP